jgi:hypothetical protein
MRDLRESKESEMVFKVKQSDSYIVESDTVAGPGYQGLGFHFLSRLIYSVEDDNSTLATKLKTFIRVR